MADITVDVNLPNAISVDVTSPTQALATNISIPGPQGPRGEKGNPTSINSLTAENIIITGVDGNVAYTSGTSTIFISGNSGYFQSAVNSLTTNLNSTGANLNTSINSLSGLFTGYTGSLDATYATDSQLANTGSTLNTKIDNLSGYVNSQDSNISNNLASTGSSLQSNINTLSSNLDSTGSNLNDKINSLSGTLTGNYLTTNIASSTYATISNLNSTGSTLNSSISSLSGTLTSNYATITNLASTGSNLQTQINNLDNVYATDASVTSVANNLASTGNALETKIGSLSGTLTSSYATISNLALTGSNLNTKIDNFSGTYQNFVDNLDSTYATDVQLQNTGTSLNNSISSLSGTLTSNYATINNLNSTGSTLETNIASTGNTLNLSINSLSGTLTSTYATITNLASTGSTLNSSINSLSGTLTSTYATINNLANTGSTLATDLASTGLNLDTKINTLSGSSVLLYGNQTISGLKDFTTRPTVNTTPVLLSGESANGLTVLVKNNDSVTLNKGQPVYIYGANGDNILVRRAMNTGETTSSKTLGLLNQSLAPNAQGLVITEGALEGIDTNAGNAGDPIWLGPTGDLIFGLVNKPYAPNHLVYLGVIERRQQNNGKIYVKVQNGFELHELHNVNIDHKNALNNSDIIRYNSSSGLWFNETLNTGIFQTQINSLSGSSVLLYGDQSVGGIKTFRDNVYINNLFVTGTETIVSTNNFNVQSPYILLNLTGGAVDGGIFFVTGSGLTGVNDTGPIIGFDHVNKFKFGISTRNSDLSTLPDIASVQDIIAYSGVADNKFSTISNLASTGSTLNSSINSLSGTLTSTYATISNLALTGSTLVTNLASTGSTLFGSINSLSGTLTSTYATISNLASTGSTLAANLASTGSTLQTNINNLSNTYATITNLASTGTTLDTKIGSLSGTLTSTYATITNLASTGSTLQTNINNLSGYINSTSSNIVFTTGNQNIAGNKNFTGDINLTGTNNRIGKSHYIETSDDFVFIKDQANNTIFSTEESMIFDGNAVQSVQWGSRSLSDSSGVNALDWDNRNLINKIGTPVLYWTGDNIGIGTNTPSEKLEVAGNLKIGGPTVGSPILYMYDAPNDAYNIATWGDNELQLGNIYNSCNLTIAFSEQGNILISNDSNLKLPTGKNDFIAMDTEVVHRTGIETISGVKTFASRPTVNGTGVLLSGEAAQVDLSTTIRTTGNQTVSGVKDFQSVPLVSGREVYYQKNIVYSTGNNFTPDSNTARTFEYVLTGLAGASATLNAPINMSNGENIVIKIKQSPSGSNNMIFNAAYKFPGSVSPSLTLTPNRVDIYTILKIDSNFYSTYVKDFVN